MKDTKQVISRVEQIDPAGAAALLQRNTQNRPLSKRLVERCATDMTEGRWHLNGQPIVIGKSGALLDGQHRLQAVIASGCTIQTLVTRGVDDESFATMDCGLSRRPADVLGIMGVPCHRTVSSSINMLEAWDNRRIGSWVTVHSSEIESLLSRKYRSLPAIVANVVSAAKSSGLRCHNSIIGACMFKMNKLSESMANQFLSDLAVGANLGIDDPVLVLRRRLSDMKVRDATGRWQAASLIVTAWNMRVRGAKSLKLVSWVPGGRIRFPSFIASADQADAPSEVVEE